MKGLVQTKEWGGVRFLHRFIKKEKHLKNHLIRKAIIYMKAASGSVFSLNDFQNSNVMKHIVLVVCKYVDMLMILNCNPWTILEHTNG